MEEQYEEKKGEFISFMKNRIKSEYIENETINILAKHFTLEELNALAEFYGSKIGRSILNKLGPAMAESTVLIQHEIRRVLAERQKEK